MNFFRVLFLPLLLPLCLIYGAAAGLRRLFFASRFRLNCFTISVGNLIVGGAGKTPLVLSLCEQFINRSDGEVFVILRDYKAAQGDGKPKEVPLDLEPRSAFLYGDEAVLIKNQFPRARVFVGRKKVEVARHISQVLNVNAQDVCIVDDGAQHLFLGRDLDLIVWDLSRVFIELFPFPLGLCRELLLWGPSLGVHIFNRENLENKTTGKILRFLFPDALVTSYEVQGLSGFNSKDFKGYEYSLIGGLGNFKQLKRSFLTYFNQMHPDLQLDGVLRGSDHDSFKWFKPRRGTVYFCTQKDYEKLRAVDQDFPLFVIESSFSRDLIPRLISHIQTLRS